MLQIIFNSRPYFLTNHILNNFWTTQNQKGAIEAANEKFQKRNESRNFWSIRLKLENAKKTFLHSTNLFRKSEIPAYLSVKNRSLSLSAYLNRVELSVLKRLFSRLNMPVSRNWETNRQILRKKFRDYLYIKL